MTDQVLVIDVGTSSVRAAVVRADGTFAAEIAQELLPDSPADGLHHASQGSGKRAAAEQRQLAVGTRRHQAPSRRRQLRRRPIHEPLSDQLRVEKPVRGDDDVGQRLAAAELRGKRSLAGGQARGQVPGLGGRFRRGRQWP